MRIALAILCLSLQLATADDAPRVLVPVDPVRPVEVAAKVGSTVQLTGPETCEWLLGSEAGRIATDRGVCAVTSDAAGRVVVLRKDGAKTSKFLVVFGDAGPGPKPPEPVDELAKKIAHAFDADGKPKADALELAAIYRAAAAKTNDAGTDNAAELVAAMKPLIDKKMPATRLASVRRLVSDELKAVLTDPNKPFTPATREATAKLFERAAAALERLGE